MSYDDEVRNAMELAVAEALIEPEYEADMVARASQDAIPPLTLKTEDGRFVKVEEVASTMAGRRRFCIVPEDQP